MLENVKRYEKLDEIDSYFEDIKESRPLSKQREKEIGRRIMEGDENAVKEMAAANLKFVVSIAKTYRKSGVPFSDLISEGNLGLMRAIYKFDYTKDIKFITYAVWWVRQAIQSCIASYNSKTPTNNIDDYEYMQLVDDEDPRHTIDPNFINEEFENDLTNIQSRRDGVDELLKCLAERERKVIMLYFGIGEDRESTLEEIGKELNLTNERVRQIKDKALVKMKVNVLNSNEFETYASLIK